jgi:hypothetical protein
MLLAFTYQERMRRRFCGSDCDEKRLETLRWKYYDFDPHFSSLQRLPKVAQLRVGFKVLPGRKRHRIRHLEFRSPAVNRRLLVRIYPGEPNLLASINYRVWVEHSALDRMLGLSN